MKQLFEKNKPAVFLIIAFLVLIIIGVLTSKAAEPTTHAAPQPAPGHTLELR